MNEKRKAGDSSFYVPVEGTENFTCKECGAMILAARVAHPIWDGPFPCSGNGQVHNEYLPYCPNCEEEPDFHGSPIITNQMT